MLSLELKENELQQQTMKKKLLAWILLYKYLMRLYQTQYLLNLKLFINLESFS
jgi:hypothetical protein